MEHISDPAQLDPALAGRRVVALFEASWCPYCRRFQAAFERLAGGQTRFEPLKVLLEEDENPLWERLGIELIPTVLFFEDGKVLRRLDGQPGVGLREADLAAALAAP